MAVGTCPRQLAIYNHVSLGHFLSSLKAVLSLTLEEILQSLLWPFQVDATEP